MQTPEKAYSDIEGLIRKFKALTAAQRRSMNEMQTRLSFILPMFAALGWDTSNMHEVSPEEKVSRGWVDFSFRLGGVPRFFLETKKANEDLNDPRWVRQAIDYAWTKSVPWALLSDFEGLRTFNAEWQVDNPFLAEFLSFDLDSYLSDFERLWWLSRPETERGRLDVEAEKVGKRSKRLPVSQRLFDDLKQWRAALYKDFRGFNPIFSPADIDAAVLRMLNRLIFIRTAEDRQVEPNRLHALVREAKDRKRFNQLHEALGKLFQEMDSVYNSELFAAHLCDKMYVTPTVLESIIDGLYERNYIHYNFNAIEADVLGTVYEQYLGSVVIGAPGEKPRLIGTQSPAGVDSLTIEERRQKRKSQGIYYTPSFVTKYIVQQTVGRYLDENGFYPRPPRVLDMACGSGSFLIEAFDCLDSYLAKQSGQAHGEQDGLHDQMRRVQILTQCLYGVDKDRQAVEVARLNLLLRGLHSRDRLPLLTNIYHGDSLRAETWQYFSEVMDDGGFDVIIGNPPYVRQETLGAEFKEYARQNFVTYAGTADLYIYFIEQAHKLLKPGGHFGMIVSNKWMRSNYGKALREFLKRESQLLEIVDFGELPVFGEIIAYPLILIFKKEKTESQQFLFAPIEHLDFITLSQEVTQVGKYIDQSVLQNQSWMLTGDIEQRVFEKISNGSEALSNYLGCKIYRGILTGLNEAFYIDEKKKDEFISKSTRNHEIIKPLLMGRNVHRYKIDPIKHYLIVIPKGWTRLKMEKDGEISEEDAWKWLNANYPDVAAHLELYKAKAKARLDQGEFWWELRACDYYSEFDRPKIIAPTIVSCATFGYDDQSYYSNDKTSIIATSDKYLLGILNSRISDFVLKRISSTKQGGYFEQKPMYIAQLPIRRLDLSIPSEKAAHDEIVRLVEEMLALQKDLAEAERDLDDRRFSLQKRIAQVDAEIDRRVYALYGLTEEEIRVVEGVKVKIGTET